MFFENTTTTGYPSSEEVTGLQVTFIAAGIIAGSVLTCTLLFCCLNHFWKPKFTETDREKANNPGPYPVTAGSKIELIR